MPVTQTRNHTLEEEVLTLKEDIHKKQSDIKQLEKEKAESVEVAAKAKRTIVVRIPPGPISAF